MCAEGNHLRPGRDDFATTRWTMVVRAGDHLSPDSRAALAELCQTYWYPLYAYVRRRLGDPLEAQDMTQAFFAELLEKNTVGAADPARGKFRAFLLVACKHFLSRQREKAQALKRGGGRRQLSLDFKQGESWYQMEPATDASPEQLFEQQWALALLGRVLGRLEGELAAAGKAEQFDALKSFLIGENAGRYADPANRLAISEAAVKMAVHRMRRRYAALLREEIAHTVNGPEEVEEEIHRLFQLFA